MILFFSVHFVTTPGQEVFVSHKPILLGDNYIKKESPLAYSDDGYWKGRLELPAGQELDFSYKYVIRNADGSLWHESGDARELQLDPKTEIVYFNDQWQGNTITAPYLSYPFSRVFYGHKRPKTIVSGHYAKEIIIKVQVAALEVSHKLYLCGSASALGCWDTQKAPAMTPGPGGIWWIAFPQDKLPQDFEYKFVCDRNVWEEGPNKNAHIPELSAGDTYVVEQALAVFPTSHPRFAGLAVPVFSLRSKNSWGVGDFADLRLLTDWAALCGQKFIQILPINDTSATGSWTDSYPYKAISVMALHPMYLNPDAAGMIADKRLNAKLVKEGKRLNALDKIDYEAVNKLKMEFAEALFAQDGASTLATDSFKEFFDSARSWLLPYAAFCVLRDRFGTADFSKWKNNTVCSESLIRRLYASRSRSRKRMDLYIFVQYLLHLQLDQAHQYASRRGIALKGDIPIGISPQSVEAWKDPHYFNMNGQAGAPPDDFSAEGQNWGFPTYDWDAMSQDNYMWWKDRFGNMARYFDAYRIDHVLGFFRIWEIPMDQVKGVMGHFSPALPYTVEEIRSEGFPFDFDLHACPYIPYYVVQEMFGNESSYVIENFLDSPAYEVFRLKEHCNTQRKIEALEGVDESIKNGLMALCSELLWIQDPMDKRKFHPRISAQYTYSYKSLPEEQKSAFNALYNQFFYHRHNAFWKEKAMHKLPEVVAATNMLSCAEDLGMIPACVPELLNDLRILTLEIQRMPKDPHERFSNPAHYPYLSVCTTGTHDTSTLRAWWEEDPGASQFYYNHILGINQAAPAFCEPWLCEKIIVSHLLSPSMLCILPLQDWLSMFPAYRPEDPCSERINLPSNPHHYWQWRMRETIEDLIRDKTTSNKIFDLINSSGR